MNLSPGCFQSSSSDRYSPEHMSSPVVSGKSENDGERSLIEDSATSGDHLLHQHASTPGFIYVLAFFSALGGFLFGYDTGVVSGAMLLLKKEMNLNALWQEMLVSSTVGAAAVSALSGGSLNGWLGRRICILVSSFIFTIGGIILSFAPDKVVLLVGRITVGLGIGIASMTVPVYIAEVSPPHMRGQLVTINSLFITGGQFIASVVDGAFSYLRRDGWRYMLGLSIVPAVLQFVGFFFLPESPRWLLQKGRSQEARQALSQIRGGQNIEEEYDTIRTSIEEEEKEAAGGGLIILRIISHGPTRRALIVGCGLQMFQQLSGINTVMYYSAQKHRQQYEEMVAQAKKRELKEAQKRKKQLEDRCKLEESIGTAAQAWNQEILPNWSAMCTSRRVRDLWWQGIPPSVRGKVWSLAVGNDLNITHELYNICLSRAKEKWTTPAPAAEIETDDAGSLDRESSLELIKLDISRTFPQLCIFQQGGPYHDVLHSILGAYTCYRPDVGYVQGMSFIAAVLILNLDTADAFIAFANLLNKPCQMAFFRVDHSLMLTYFAAFEVFFEENLPKLFAHFKKNNLTPDIYLIDWIFTLYSKSLPLDLACRVWDVFCRDSEEFLFRTALGLLRLYQDVLTCMDFIHMAQFLTRLPDFLPAEQLFQHIAAVHMTSRNRKWSQVLQALQKDLERGSPVLKR